MAQVVTITNPVTGQPVQVDQLDHTAQQIDDAVEAARWSHRNLLDNAYWANPDAIIDQRGGYVAGPDVNAYSDPDLTNLLGTVGGWANTKYVSSTVRSYEYSGNTFYVSASDCIRGYVGSGYTIDRWHSNGYNGQPVLINADGLAAYPGVGFSQKNETSFVGKTMTFSILDTSNHLELFTFEYQSAFHELQGQVYNLQFGDNVGILFHLRVDQTASRTVRAAKLELGTVQTLAHQDENGNWVLNDPPPDKGMELAKCQMYQVFPPYRNTNGFAVIGVGIYQTENRFIVFIPIPVTLRTTPSILTGDVSKFLIRKTDGTVLDNVVTGISLDSVSSTGISIGVTVSATLAPGEAYILYTRESNLFGFDANL